VNPLTAPRTSKPSQHLTNQENTENKFYRQSGKDSVPFGGDVNNKEDLPLVGLQVHFLAVAILLREEISQNLSFAGKKTAKETKNTNRTTQKERDLGMGIAAP
jgi:hypothetical protein